MAAQRVIEARRFGRVRGLGLLALAFCDHPTSRRAWKTLREFGLHVACRLGLADPVPGRAIRPWADRGPEGGRRRSLRVYAPGVVDERASRAPEAWPELPLETWSDTYATLHLWLQIVGKIRHTLGPRPPLNHCWGDTLYVTAWGLTTSPIPSGNRNFEIDFDFIGHRLWIETGEGRTAEMPLQPQSVAAFYAKLFRELDRLGLDVRIHARPNEVADPIPFEKDETHASYDAEYANRFWRVLAQADRVFKKFRSRFIGKCSPVHLFWGAPDLAVTRFSGRVAPVHPGGVPNLPDRVTRDAYSHEVSSAGFWPGGGPVPHAAFYAYAYPEPAGFADAKVGPEGAFYSKDLHEFLLPYDAVRLSPTPDDTLLEFLQTTYAAAADLGGWDRKSLEQKAAAAPASR